MKFQRVVLCVLAILILGTATACTEYGGIQPELRPAIECVLDGNEKPECAKYRPPEPSEPPDPYANRDRLTLSPPLVRSGVPEQGGDRPGFLIPPD